MNHDDAIKTDALARYLLREMPEDEQGIFEEHYFDCVICAEDVRYGTRMMAAGKAVMDEELEPVRTSNVVPFWKQPWMLPATAAASLILPLLGGGVGYRMAMSRHQPTELVRVVRLDTGISRAGTPAGIPAVRPGEELRFDVVPSDDAVRYAADVTCSGKTESTHGISREMAADAVSLRLGELPAGRCELVIRGVRKDGKRFRISSSPFMVGER